ncbi:MAG: hypothetical protein GQ570_08895 [Helicobacteraceae bacterium]|nr:hypothetical protein [Helicobacteraceae bacterium]
MKLLLLFTTLFLLLGCSSKEPATPTYPEWYDSTSRDSTSTFYATANGNTEADAIASALNSIASRVSVEVESVFNSNVHVNSKSYDKDIELNIKNSVKKIEFNNYIVLNKKSFEAESIVKVAVNRVELANEYKSKIENALSSISTKLNKKYKNTIAKLKEYNTITKLNSSLRSDIYTLKSINSAINIDPYLNYLNETLKVISEFKSSVVFYISSTQNSYSKALAEQITLNGYRISKNYPSIKINFILTKQRHAAVGNKILKGTINMSAYDASNSTLIGNSRVVLGAKSINSYKRADEFMLNSFKAKLKSEDLLFNFLGI